MAGGGTGGHVFVGVSIAREFQARDPDCDVCFVGTARPLESDILKREGFPLEVIDVGGLKGMSGMRLVANLLLLPRSLTQSWRILRRFRPHVVLGVGGYSSGPVLLAAALLRLPTIIVEPNAFPGLANRLLARIVRQAAVAFTEARARLGGKGVETGIPVRREFFKLAQRPPGRPFSILLSGGSQGSRALNHAMCDALPHLKDYGRRLRIVHQTGAADLVWVRERYQREGMMAGVCAFIHNMPEEFDKADLIIGRAGAATVAELAAAGKAALLIPLPTAADDHQRKNAEALAVRGAARVLEQAELTGARLADEIRAFIERPEKLVAMSAACRALGKPAAAAQIVDLALAAMKS